MTVAVFLIAVLIVAALAAVALRPRSVPAPLESPAEPAEPAPETSETDLGVVAPLEGVAPAVASEPLADRGPPLPIVLVHGLFGFDRIARFHYFHRIAEHLESLGCTAVAVRLPPARAVPDRARVLADAIAALGHPRVDLIAHSLGGLDARYALSKLGLASRVRSLVTIGTPHRGTPLADLAADGPLRLARRAIAALGVSLEAVDWLSTDALARFNAETPDAPGVRYACVVGGIHGGPAAMPLSVAHAYLTRVAGDNDGLVPVSSQYWGETLAEIDADHFQQIGWRIAVRHTFDALGLYAFVVARLGDQPRLVATS